MKRFKVIVTADEVTELSKLVSVIVQALEIDNK